jgi:hypothetical protein
MPPGSLSGNFNKHRNEKIVVAKNGKKKYSARKWKVCAAYI